MEVTAITRYVRMSPSKARDFARELKGLSVNDALKLVTVGERKAAIQVGKTLKSAVANASNNADLSVDALTVKEAVIEEGPAFKRFRPVARGAAHPIKKRTCHIRVVLTDGEE